MILLVQGFRSLHYATLCSLCCVTTHQFTNFALTTLNQSWQKHVSLSSAV